MRETFSLAVLGVLTAAAAVPITAGAQQVFSDGFESGDCGAWSSPGCFSPDQVAGLWGWWDAELNVTVVDGTVTQWGDQSGNGRNWIQLSETDRPSYIPIAQANRPAIEWGPSNSSWLDLDDFINPSSNDIEVFVVARSTLNLSWGALLHQRSVNGRAWLNFGGSDLESYIGGTPVQAFGAVDVFEVNVFHMSYDSSEQSLELFKNGGSVGQADEIVGEFCDGNLMLGRSKSYDFIEGYIYEVIIYDEALTPNDRDAVVAYLQRKWYTTIPPESSSPSDLDDLWGWWRADAGTISGTGGIAFWEDQSGNSLTLQQSIFNRRPQLDPDVQNSLPGLFFDNVDDHLENLNDTLDFATEDATIFLVMDTQKETSCPMASLDGQTGIGRAWFENQANRGQVYIGGNPAPLSLDGGNVFGPSILTVFYDGEYGVTQYGVNGWIWGVATNVVGESNPDGGTRVGDAKADINDFNGYIFEIVVYNRVLTWPERQRIINYLNDKWSIF